MGKKRWDSSTTNPTIPQEMDTSSFVQIEAAAGPRRGNVSASSSSGCCLSFVSLPLSSSSSSPLLYTHGSSWAAESSDSSVGHCATTPPLAIMPSLLPNSSLSSFAAHLLLITLPSSSSPSSSSQLGFLSSINSSTTPSPSLFDCHSLPPSPSPFAAAAASISLSAALRWRSRRNSHSGDSHSSSSSSCASPTASLASSLPPFPSSSAAAERKGSSREKSNSNSNSNSDSDSAVQDSGRGAGAPFFVRNFVATSGNAATSGLRSNVQQLTAQFRGVLQKQSLATAQPPKRKLEDGDEQEDEEGEAENDNVRQMSPGGGGDTGKAMAVAATAVITGRKSKAIQTTQHLSAGAIAAMVSRTIVAPLERLKLEFLVRGAKGTVTQAVKNILRTEGVRGFWKGNGVNLLRTAPFKSINFFAYDMYRKQLLKWGDRAEVTNVERLAAGAMAGITATMLCFPLDTLRTLIVAPGGEALGGLRGCCAHLVKTEGFFALYRGLLPAVVSMAPSGAVFYGVYDILKTAYLTSPEGKQMIAARKRRAEERPDEVSNQLELGPFRTLLYGALAGACAETVTYPLEVVRRAQQMQHTMNKRNMIGTMQGLLAKGGVGAFYAGLLPSTMQVLPSAALSYFVYESVKVAFKIQ